MTEGHPSDSSVFANNMSVRENATRLEFSPSAPALIDIARQSYAELITDDYSLSKVLLPEYYAYYSTAMLWLRIITLKQKNSQPITQAEDALLVLTQTMAFNLPEPLLLQIKQLGNVVAMTKQHLYPKFPPLPDQVIHGLSRYYGTLAAPAPGVDNNLNNLYEELPCLGVTAEAVCNAISNAPPGPYQSNVTFESLQPNSNLLGFRPLGSRRNEPKNLAFDNEIKEVDFPAYPANTGFNYRFITAISNNLANTKTFKSTPVVFSTLSEVGSQSQLVPARPLVQPGQNCLRGEQVATSLSQDSLSVFGASIFFDSQLG